MTARTLSETPETKTFECPVCGKVLIVTLRRIRGIDGTELPADARGPAARLFAALDAMGDLTIQMGHVGAHVAAEVLNLCAASGGTMREAGDALFDLGFDDPAVLVDTDRIAFAYDALRAFYLAAAGEVKAARNILAGIDL